MGVGGGAPGTVGRAAGAQKRRGWMGGAVVACVRVHDLLVTAVLSPYESNSNSSSSHGKSLLLI